MSEINFMTASMGYDDCSSVGNLTTEEPSRYFSGARPEVLLLDYANGTKLFIEEDGKYRRGTQKEFALALGAIRKRFEGDLKNVPHPRTAGLPSTSERIKARLDKGETIFAPEVEDAADPDKGTTEIICLEGELYIQSFNQGGYDCTLVKITGILEWVSKHAPDLLPSGK